MIYFLIGCIIIYLLIPTKKVKFRFLNLRHNLIPLAIILLLILLVVFSNDSFNSAKNGLELWMKNVVPSLFPFLICLEILKRTNIIRVIGKVLEPVIRPIFNIPGSGVFAVIMGMCSGYPVGAKFASSLREEGECSKAEGERLLAFTNTSGPLFIIGAVGIGMLSNSKIGFLLLITHFISALLVGVIFRFHNVKGDNKLENGKGKNKADIENDKLKNTTALKNEANLENLEIQNKSFKSSEIGLVMGEAIKSSIATLLLICGFIVFFSVLGTILKKAGITAIISEILSKFLILFGFQENIANELGTYCFEGLLEMTGGLKQLANINLELKTILPIMATILGFGGVSVHLQVASIISNTDLSIKPYLLGKTLHGCIAGLLTYFMINYTNFLNLETVETFSNIASKNVSSITGSGNLLIWALSILIILSLLVIMFRKSTYKD